MPSEYIYTVQGGPSTPSLGIPGTLSTLINDPQQPVHGIRVTPEEIISEEDCEVLSLCWMFCPGFHLNQ